MTGMTIFSIVLLIFVAVTVANGVRIVPQGEEWVVQRLGKYRSTLLPGLRFIIPYIDIVSYKVTTKDIILDVQEQEVITRGQRGDRGQCHRLHQGHRPGKSRLWRSGLL
jgi:regulator of protease activity HflC (stomatin/prohibitin superfamily)